MNAEVVIGCLILFTCHHLVSTLCSTCLEERCYENGECIIGCVPGYVGKYCSEACPSRCLNKACHRDRIDGTITCTDGCKPGYCGIQCSESCSEGCVTCNRQCGSCNVTLCPERRYGANCSEKCSPKYGKCDRETGQCIICRQGYYGDECTRECTDCFTRAKTIIDSCLSGCDICQDEVTCPTVFHGITCDLKCSSGCDKPGGCNRATGECSTGCVSGYHGLNCNCTCSEHCLSGRCNRATGECSSGCESGYHGLNCSATCSKFCVGGMCNQQNGICTSGCETGYISNVDKCEASKEATINLALHLLLVCLCVILVAAVVAVASVKLRNWLLERSKKRKAKHDRSGRAQATDAAEPLLNYNRDRDTVQIHSDRPGQVWTVTGSATGTVQVLRNEHSERLRARTMAEIEFNTSGMIRVSAVDLVLRKLNEGHRWVTITGNAGDGKTTLGYLVLKELLQKNVFTIYKPEEYHQIADVEGQTVIMFDDRFGAFLADEKLIKDWLDVITKLIENQISVIFVSRKNVVNESRMYLGILFERMFDPTCVVDLSLRKGTEEMTEERIKILDYHLQHNDVSAELKRRVANKEIAHGFPHCCKMYSKLRSSGYDMDIEAFFESPLKFLDMTTKILYKDNCKSLFQMMIRNGGEFDVYNVTDEDKRQELLQVEKEQEGSYITVWRNGICTFAHPSVYESVLNVINDIDPLHCAQYATLSVIRQKMLISTSDEEDRRRSPCYIIIKPVPAVLKALAERFRGKILKGDYSIFKHRLCQSIEFCQVLVSCCLSTNEFENGSKQFINKPGENGETILWTALKSGGMCAVQTLIKAQADVNMQDDRGRTPLHYLFQPETFPAAVADVVVHGFGDDQRNVVSNITEMIITEGKGDVNITDDYGQTPLHYLCQLETTSATAVENRDCRVMNTIKLIITEGKGDINVRDQYGHTPLHYLFKSKTVSKKDIQWIVTEAKGDLNKCEQNKSTPLHHLCANSELQLDIVDVLITEGKGDFNKGDEFGTTPFHHLCGNREVDIDVVNRIIDTAKGDINKQDDNGITPLHVLFKGSNQRGSILELMNQGNKADSYGNTPLHYICRRPRGSIDDILQELEKMLERYMKKENIFGLTPSGYLHDEDGTLPFREAMIDRSAADLVLFKLEYGDRLITVLGRPMTLSSQKVNKLLQVFDLVQELTNMARSGDKKQGQFTVFRGTCSNHIPFLPSQVISTSYWETISTIKATWKEKGFALPLLEVGVVEGRIDLDKKVYLSNLPRSVCVSVTDNCSHHSEVLCMKVWQRDRGRKIQVGECVTLPCPKSGNVITFTFGLLLDNSRGRVVFMDLERGKLLCKVEQKMIEDIVPMFFVPALYESYDTTIRLISGRQISVDERKKQLIHQALLD